MTTFSRELLERPGQLKGNSSQIYNELQKKIDNNTGMDDVFDFSHNNSTKEEVVHALGVYFYHRNGNFSGLAEAVEKFEELSHTEEKDNFEADSEKKINMQEVIDAGKDAASAGNDDAEETGNDASSDEDDSCDSSNSGSNSHEDFNSLLKEYCNFYKSMQKTQQEQAAVDEKNEFRAMIRQMLLSMLTGNTMALPGNNPWAVQSSHSMGDLTLDATYRAATLAGDGNFAKPTATSPFTQSTNDAMSQLADPMALLNQFMMARIFDRMLGGASNKGCSHDSEESGSGKSSGDSKSKPTSYKWQKPSENSEKTQSTTVRSDGLTSEAKFINNNPNQPFTEIREKGKDGQRMTTYVDEQGQAHTDIDGKDISGYHKTINNDDFMIAIEDEFKNNFDHWYNWSGKHLDVDEIMKIVKRKGIQNITRDDVEEFVSQGSKQSLDYQGGGEINWLTDKDFEVIKQDRGGKGFVRSVGITDAAEPGKAGTGRDGDSPVAVAAGKDGTVVHSRLNGDGTPFGNVYQNPNANAYERIMRKEEYRPLLAGMQQELIRRQATGGTLDVGDVLNIASGKGIKLDRSDAKILVENLSGVIKGDYNRFFGTDGMWASWLGGSGNVTLGDLNQAFLERGVTFDTNVLRPQGWGKPRS